MKYILIILSALSLASCMTTRKATDYLKDKGELPGICADEYPVKDSVIVKDSITLDTVFVGSDPVFDTVTQTVNDTVVRVVTKTLPAKVITKTQVQIKEVYRENTARVVALQGEIGGLKIALSKQTDKANEAKDEAGTWRKKAKRRWWWIVGLIAFAFRRQILGFVTKLPINMFKTFLPAVLVLFLTSCGHHRDGTSVWAGGLFVLPVILLAFAAFFLLKAYRSSRSGSKQMRPGVGLVESDENLPIWQIPFFWYGVALIVATAVVALAVNLEK